MTACQLTVMGFGYIFIWKRELTLKQHYSFDFNASIILMCCKRK